jgi:hypothetical protein
VEILFVLTSQKHNSPLGINIGADLRTANAVCKKGTAYFKPVHLSSAFVVPSVLVPMPWKLLSFAIKIKFTSTNLKSEQYMIFDCIQLLVGIYFQTFNSDLV